MRSGKRSLVPPLVSWNPATSEEGSSDYVDASQQMDGAESVGVEKADLGIGVQPLNSLVLRRVTLFLVF